MICTKVEQFQRRQTKKKVDEKGDCSLQCRMRQRCRGDRFMILSVSLINTISLTAEVDQYLIKHVIMLQMHLRPTKLCTFGNLVKHHLFRYPRT